MAERRRLVISDSDLPAAAPPAASASVGAPVAPPASGLAAPAYQLPSIEGIKPPPLQVGAPRPAGGTSLGATLPTNVVAGLVAGLVGWGLFELLVADAGPTGHPVQQAALQFGFFAAIFGAVFAAWDDLMTRVWESSLKSGAIGLAIGAASGAISGAIAQTIYGSVIENVVRDAFENGSSLSPTDLRLTGARALGWAIIGLGVGLASGLARQSAQKVLNGLVGGALGGALGGFLFNYIGEATQSEGATRLIAFTISGLLIGTAIGLIEVARRQAWLKIVGGGMTGKEFIVYHANTNVGSSPKCQITLIKDAAVAPFHFRIDEHGNRRSLAPYQGCTVTINGAPATQQWLRNGDLIQAGASTLQYSERTAA